VVLFLGMIKVEVSERLKKNKKKICISGFKAEMGVKKLSNDQRSTIHWGRRKGKCQ
jgi:hypothetical protein